ncbi:hypothetical protein CRYUN_Cryun04dG0197600 [Craigia yunnanensis]
MLLGTAQWFDLLITLSSLALCQCPNDDDLIAPSDSGSQRLVVVATLYGVLLLAWLQKLFGIQRIDVEVIEAIWMGPVCEELRVGDSDWELLQYIGKVATAITRGGVPTDNGDSAVTLDQVPRWSDAEYRSSLEYENEDPSFSNSYFPDPLTSPGEESCSNGMVLTFPVDHEINSKIYLWRGQLWNLEVDAVVNSSNENLDEAHSSQGLHAAAGPGLAEECATPEDKITAVIFCTSASSDTEIYKRLLPLYFPRDKHEEEVAISKLPADVGDENGDTIIDERKIRIKPLPKKTIPKPPQAPVELPVSDVGLVRRNSNYLDTYLDPAFMSLIKDPDQRRQEQWGKTAQAKGGWNCAKMLGFGDLVGLHYLLLKNTHFTPDTLLSYRRGVGSEGRAVMVVVGAHFLLRCLELECFVLYVVKEFEPLIQKPYTIVYFHSAASLQIQPDVGWMRRLQQILGRKHHNCSFLLSYMFCVGNICSSPYLTLKGCNFCSANVCGRCGMEESDICS